jgi:hypothetical protein
LANRQLSEVLEHLRRAVLPREGAGLTDGQLLEESIRRRDEAALAALVASKNGTFWFFAIHSLMTIQSTVGEKPECPLFAINVHAYTYCVSLRAKVARGVRWFLE